MNKLTLALVFSAIGATAASAQVISLNTGSSIVTDRRQTDGTWRREGNTDIYTRTRIDANGNRVLDRARRDALGNFILADTRILTRNDNRGRTDNTWKRSENENRVYVRQRVDANGNRIIEKARRDASGRYIVFDSRVIAANQNGKSKDSKWKKDKDGKKWDKAVNQSGGKGNGKGKNR